MSQHLFSLSAPQFWWQPRPTILAQLLKPLGQFYGFITSKRMAKSGVKLGIPIVCIGNLTVGGAGKTPIALALGALLQTHGYTIAFVSRGYGSKAILRQPLRVDVSRHEAYDVGDEALLLARRAPTYVCKNRLLAARAAMNDGANVVILDDGLQNPSLAKTLTLAVIPAQNPLGNGFCFPAGPLRAPVQNQLYHIDALVVLSQAKEAAPDDLNLQFTPAHMPKFMATIIIDAQTLSRLKGKRIFAFAGIGNPEKFFASLRAQDVLVEETQNFPDHYDYTRQDYDRLVSIAQQKSLHLVTTEKDFVKIKAFDFKQAIMPVPIEARFETPELVQALLHARVAASTMS